MSGLVRNLKSAKLYDVMIFCQVKVESSEKARALVETILTEIDKHPEVVISRLYNFRNRNRNR